MSGPEIQVFVDQHVHDHHGYDPAQTFRNLMEDCLSFHNVSDCCINVDTSIPLDGRNYSTSLDIYNQFDTYVTFNVGKSNIDDALLIFDETDGDDTNGWTQDKVSVAKANDLANLDTYSPPRWAEMDPGTGMWAGDAALTAVHEVGHALGLCGSCHSNVHDCGINYDQTYSFPGDWAYPGDSDDFCRTPYNCDDDGGPNECNTFGVDVIAGAPWDKNWADAYYWYDCAGNCLRSKW